MCDCKIKAAETVDSYCRGGKGWCYTDIRNESLCLKYKNIDWLQNKDEVGKTKQCRFNIIDMMHHKPLREGWKSCPLNTVKNKHRLVN